MKKYDNTKEKENFIKKISKCDEETKISSLKDYIQEKQELEKQHATKQYSQTFIMMSKIQRMDANDYAIAYLDFLNMAINELEGQALAS